MSRRTYLILFSFALILQIAVSRLQSIPGYLDADYYFSGGVRLVQGYGFTEPYLWNYLDDPQGIPHPSHGYWLPLASIISALGMWLTGQQTYEAGRLFFIVIAAFIPPLTAALSYHFFQSNALAWVSGLLALFPVFHLPFLPVPDNYGIFMLAGGLFFLLANRPRPWFWLGLIAGVMSLARSDGLLWLALTFLLVLWRMRDEELSFSTAFQFSALTLLGFLLVMGPWYLRNLSVFGAIMSPAGSRVLWITTYDETFIYPASKLTLTSWLASGWGEIFKIRWWAFITNLKTAIAAQGHLILFPFIAMGMFLLRKDRRVQLGLLAWVLLFLVMTFIFPFAGVRGSFFHAGAALQPLFWVLVPYSLDSVVAWVRKRSRLTDYVYVVIRIVLIQTMVVFSVWVVLVRVIDTGWEEGELSYPAVERFLVEQGAQPGEPIIVLSAPGYYMMTGRPAFVQPYGDVNTLLEVAEQYNARYYAFEASGRLKLLLDLYDNPKNYPQLEYLGEVDDTRIFRFP
ncbi:MAG: hypothetical protein IPG80_17945 [Anaerolineales bacterium]|uniref:hypothetical protein n=1 Tax=Candidatus Villigracilis vicinus TaxID=3140679 RepID=UPI003134FB66|nr:hypothetical protein [Anaerolineales bacterium]